MPLSMNLLFALIMILVCVTVTELTRKYFLPNSLICPPHYPTANRSALRTTLLQTVIRYYTTDGANLPGCGPQLIET